MRKIYLLHRKDNVAVALDELKPGQLLEIDENGRKISITVQESIQFGHKIAIKFVKKKDRIIKYGEDIGFATCHINEGQWVHTHNISSERGKRRNK